MEALTNLSNKFFTRNVDKISSPSRSSLLGRSENNFLASAAFKKAHFDRLVLFLSTDVRRVAAKSHRLSNIEVVMGADAAVSGIQKIQPSKTVHVKFQLQKMCMYGEEFQLVGDNPMMGSWDPSSAIPLNWSDGHLWNVELDVPIELAMQYKFILKRTSGEVLWQPGPDRVFKTWENKNTVIVITEDWDEAGDQKITEEQVTVDQVEDPGAKDPYMELTGENISHGVVIKDLRFSAGTIAYAENKPKPNINYELVSRSTINYPEEFIGIRKEEPMQNNNVLTLKGKNQVSAEDDENLSSFGESSALLPDLSPLQMVSTEEALSKELESIIADNSIGVDSAKE